MDMSQLGRGGPSNASLPNSQRSSRSGTAADPRGTMLDISQLPRVVPSTSAQNSQRSGAAESDPDPRGKVMTISQLNASPSPSPIAASASPAPSSAAAAGGDPRGKVMDMSQLASLFRGPASEASAPAAGGLQPRSVGLSTVDPRSAPQSQRSQGLPGPAAEAAAEASYSANSRHAHGALEAALVPPELTQLPSSSAQWRVDRLAGSEQYSFTAPMPEHEASQVGAPLPPATTVPRTHDAVPRHLASHAWDLASLGQEPPQIPREAWPQVGGSSASGGLSRAQPPLGSGLAPVGGGPRGFGGARGPLEPGLEAQLVERLAQRFVLDRKAPTLEKRERCAYQEMLQQVAWTALEPLAAQEAASLLSRRWLAPVSSVETLRAFRRCLHSILSDERVLDIVELQMAAHFSRHAAGLGPGPAG